MEKKLKLIKNHILGEKYELSLVFAKNELMKKLNTIYRGKNKPTNVLSFPLTKNEGEIFINQKNKKETPLLFIHALLHLKKYKHGEKMEKEEEKLLKKFYGPQHNNRN